MAKLSALLLRLIPRTVLGRASLAFIIGFAFTGLAVPQIRFLWASFLHAGF